MPHDRGAGTVRESLGDLDQNLTGLEFVHPVDIGEQWREINCTGCHTPEEGY